MEENKTEQKAKLPIVDFTPLSAITAWDAIEVQPVCYVDDGKACEVCDRGQENFWSVYLHQVEGGVLCIADLENEKQADDLAELIKNAVKSFKQKA